MDKRNTYILIGAGFILIILIVLTLTLSSRKQQPDQGIISGQPAGGEFPSQMSSDNQFPSELNQYSQEKIAEDFYNWYVNHPDPLGSGDYQKNPFLTEDFKETLSGFVFRGDYLNSEPVLTCIGITPPKDIVASPAVFEGSEASSVILQRKVEGSIPLYKVVLKNVNQQWLIDDVRCVI